MWWSLLASVPAAGVLVGITLGSVLVAAAGLLVLRRAVPVRSLQPHHDVAGPIFGAITVVYGVFQAFVFSAAWAQFSETADGVTREANALGDLYRDAGVFGDPAGLTVREHLRRYAEAVIDDEWPAMVGGQASPRAAEAFEALWGAYLTIDPRNARESTALDRSTDRLADLADLRRDRLLNSRLNVPPLMWGLLVGGAVVVVGFTGLFGVAEIRVHIMMAAILACMVTYILYAILALDLPFSTDARISPEPIRRVVERFG
jgi:hypothetical protein